MPMIVAPAAEVPSRQQMLTSMMNPNTTRPLQLRLRHHDSLPNLPAHVPFKVCRHSTDWCDVLCRVDGLPMIDGQDRWNGIYFNLIGNGHGMEARFNKDRLPKDMFPVTTQIHGLGANA